MASLDQVQLPLEKIEPDTGDITDIQQGDDNSWTLILENETEIRIDFVEEQQNLVQSTDLGALPHERRAFGNEFMLIYNFKWTRSGGVKIGLEGPNGGNVMMFEYNAKSIDLRALQQIVRNVAEQSRSWRELIALGLKGGVQGDARSDNLSPNVICV